MAWIKDQWHSAGLTLGTAALLCFTAFVAGGGRVVTSGGAALVVIVLIATALFGRVAFTGRAPHPFAGFTTTALLTAYALWVGLSIDWSILPDDSLVDAGRTLAYVAVFAAFALLAQLLRGQHDRLLIGLLLAAVAICAYALFSRIVPGWFPATDNFARLRLPFEYWNAVGLVAAAGLIGALWLGTQRAGGRAVLVASYPAGILLWTALMMSQSRGALVAAAIGVAIWLVLVPRRLRSVGWLGAVVAIGVWVVAWVFAQDALSNDGVAASLRSSAGWKFALVLTVALGLAVLAGLLIEAARERRPLSGRERYQLGKAFLVVLAVSPLFLVAGLAATERGAWGTVSHAVSDLTDASKVAPGNSPDRLTQTSSLRARYWSDGFEVWADHKLKGTGADTFTSSRLPYRQDTVKVRHTHGFVPQTLADLGLVGMGLALAALVAWVIAALRALQSRREAPHRWLEGADDRRCALAGIVCVALVFGVHSTVDWTWYVPGAALFGLAAAGWVAGSARNAEVAAGGNGEASAQPLWMRATLAAGVVLIGLATALSIYGPAQAADAVSEGYRLATEGHPYKALEQGREAHRHDRLADEPFYLIADAQNVLDKNADAEKTLETIAVRQPANPDTWLHLAEFRLRTLRDPEGALSALRPLLFLSPNSERGLALQQEAKQALVTQRYEEAVRKARAKYRRQVRKYLRENPE